MMDRGSLDNNSDDSGWDLVCVRVETMGTIKGHFVQRRWYFIN